VYFYDRQGQLKLIPASWTDARKADPFVELAAGRARFRLQDLLALAELIDGLINRQTSTSDSQAC
jgi:hypothetical protein